jgi:DNA-binding MarR family transcriptional regulator
MAAWRSFLVAHARVLEVLADELEAECGLPLTWYDVLVQLEEAPDHRLRMQELARAVLLSKSGLTRLVDRMGTAGLVGREPCPDDRRGTFVVLTGAGIERLHSAAPTHMRGVIEHFTGQLTEEEAVTLGDVLGRIGAAQALGAAAG